MAERCVDHLDFVGSVCPSCGLDVDAYANTEAQFDNCCFPDCGCDGARLCMAPSGASEYACTSNVEGMWSGKTVQQRKAVFDLIGRAAKGKGRRP